jgi:glycerol-3-phosphate dehydrogenase
MALFDRNRFLKLLDSDEIWDMVIIGGGATGLGTAVDSALRGYRTLLLEQADFAKGTSSRSTKLVHGGVRYLAQGDIALVYEALHERQLLFQNAPHLAKEQEFIIPCYGLKSKFMYLIGLKIYDLLAGRRGFKSAAFLSADKVIQAIPLLKRKGLLGGVRYSDGQFDDSRLAINLAQTAAENNGVLLNYMKVTGLTKSDARLNGVIATDVETGKEYTIKAKTIVNATGVFVDEILQMDIPSERPLVRPSQGVHLVLDKSFLGESSALMIPKTDDGRVLFAVPWHGKALIGTTDTPLDQHSLEPIALEKEIEFILRTASQYLTRAPERKDVLSVFAGLRPLAAPGKDTSNTKEISRSHKIIVSVSGLITVIGGKWTTYRRMAEEIVDKAIQVSGLEKIPCASKNAQIHGYTTSSLQGSLAIYGDDAAKIKAFAEENPSLNVPIENGYSPLKAEVVWQIRNEMARKIEDVLARRLRVLFLDAKTAIRMAPAVAEIIAAELNHSKEWQQKEVAEFTALANNYLLEPYIPQ